MEGSNLVSKNNTFPKIVQHLVDCPLNANTSYSCNSPYPNCTNPHGFQFSSLWTISQNIYNACTSDWRLFDNQSPALSQAGCEQIVGSDDWTRYPGADIWARLTTWKFPLLQLVAIFPRPPLSFSSELFVILHLMGDPIGTIKDLLLKMASCQDRAARWVDLLQTDLKELIPEERQNRYPRRVQIWKAFGTIVDSYDEWGQEKGNLATGFLKERLISHELSVKDKLDFVNICQQTANALAADRSTKFLPIIVAQGFFIGAVAIAFGRTRDAASGDNPTTFINIEAHSIAFTSLYFWVIPAVFLSSVIGVSQTENAIPRILRRLQADLDHRYPTWTVSLPNDHLTEANEDCPNTALRERSGGLYSWQPKKARDAVLIQIPEPTRKEASTVKSGTFWTRYGYKIHGWMLLRPGSVVFAVIVVTLGALTGILISVLIPPVGFECRNIGEIAIYFGWLLSAALDYIPFGDHYSWHFWFAFVKDLLATVATMGGIIATQVGVFNRCSCYTIWGKTGLAFPEITFVAGTLSHRIETVYPALAFLCVGFQLIAVPYIITIQYPHAIRVFLSRDDNTSNMKLWHTVRSDFSREDGSIFRRGARSLRTIFSWSTPVQSAPVTSAPLVGFDPVPLSTSSRTRTSAMEMGEVDTQAMIDDEQLRLVQRVQYHQ